MNMNLTHILFSIFILFFFNTFSLEKLFLLQSSVKTYETKAAPQKSMEEINR